MPRAVVRGGEFEPAAVMTPVIPVLLGSLPFRAPVLEATYGYTMKPFQCGYGRGNYASVDWVVKQVQSIYVYMNRTRVRHK